MLDVSTASRRHHLEVRCPPPGATGALVVWWKRELETNPTPQFPSTKVLHMSQLCRDPPLRWRKFPRNSGPPLVLLASAEAPEWAPGLPARVQGASKACLITDAGAAGGWQVSDGWPAGGALRVVWLADRWRAGRGDRLINLAYLCLPPDRVGMACAHGLCMEPVSLPRAV